METQRKFGTRSGIIIPTIGFGGSTIGGEEHPGYKERYPVWSRPYVPPHQAKEALSHYYDRAVAHCGVAFFDTAPYYEFSHFPHTNDSEKRIGDFLVPQ